jgi:phenylpropionate dioxygenase-like ring-hydroxylating dioxygenase large terminal subunit
MLKNFWYACAVAKDLTTKPKKVTILGQDIVLYRDSKGQAVALHDLCVHRGASLAGGWVEDDCIRCPYHGWKYASGGQCVDIPANKKGLPVPQRARVDSYPVVERYNWIWVFLGDLDQDKRPPVPELPWAEMPGWRAVHGEFTWKAHYARVVENGVDIAHTPFVHGGSFGNREQPEVEDYDVVHTDWGIEARATLMPPRPPGLWRLIRRKRNPVKARVAVIMPNITVLELQINSWTMVIVDSNIPVDEHTTHTHFQQFRNFFTGSWADRDAFRRTLKIFKEDQPTVESQRPELLPYDIGAELHLKSDAMGVAYRKLRNKYIDMGWRVDPSKAPRERGSAMVVPSPIRRDANVPASAWVMPEMPVQEPAEPKTNGRTKEVH